MATTTQKSDFISQTRQVSTDLIDAYNALITMRTEWYALNLGTEIKDEDFVGENEGLTVYDLSAVIGTTLTAIESLMGQGHATNLYKISK